MINENYAAEKGSDCVSIYSHTAEIFLTVLVADIAGGKEAEVV